MVQGVSQNIPEGTRSSSGEAESGLTLKHVGLDGVAEASKTYTKLAGARGSPTFPHGRF